MATSRAGTLLTDFSFHTCASPTPKMSFSSLGEEDEFEVGDFEAGGLGKEAAVEIADALEPAAGGRRAGVHGVEQATEEVIGTGGGGAILEHLGDELLGEQINVLGEEGDEHLEDEALGGGAFDVALDEFLETVGETIGGLA